MFVDLIFIFAIIGLVFVAVYFVRFMKWLFRRIALWLSACDACRVEDVK